MRKPLVNVKAIRARLRLSQAQFAEHYGFKVRTLQDWGKQPRAAAERRSRLPHCDRSVSGDGGEGAPGRGVSGTSLPPFRMDSLAASITRSL